MACGSCGPCGPCTAAERQFDERVAARDLARYRRKGLRVTSRLLLAGLRASGPLQGTLLDLGAGIGSLTLELLDSGVERAVAIDASPAYVAAGREETRRRGRAERIDWRQGDFVEQAGAIASATTVTLDRVVCCYPSCEALLGAALARAERCLALSYPRDRWYVRAVVAADNSVRRLRRNPFRTFVHPASAIGRLIAEQGFRLAHRSGTLAWCADVWLRERAGADSHRG